MIHALLPLASFTSFLSPLEHALRHVLDWLHTTVGLSWAWSIVALTVIVRMILVPLTIRQIHSMQSLQRHAPEMKAIQQKYKHDKQRQNEELMKFYKENNINPAASCLPMVAQFPVFIALYYVLKNFTKHVPAGSDLSWLGFIPSIADKTTSHWGGYILLVVYVVSQMASTLYMSATASKSQRTLITMMPIVFVFVVARFPTGLVLYWMTTNLWTVGQGLITRRLIPKTAAPSLGGLRAKTTPPPPEQAQAKPQPQRQRQRQQPAPRVQRRKKKGRR